EEVVPALRHLPRRARRRAHRAPVDRGAGAAVARVVGPLIEPAFADRARPARVRGSSSSGGVSRSRPRKRVELVETSRAGRDRVSARPARLSGSSLSRPVELVETRRPNPPTPPPQPPTNRLLHRFSRKLRNHLRLCENSCMSTLVFSFDTTDASASAAELSSALTQVMPTGEILGMTDDALLEHGAALELLGRQIDAR